MTNIDRIKRRVMVNSDTGCWEWQGSKTGGYPRMRYGGKTVAVTRLMCPGITPETYACHRCDNPSCVNPDHLFAGTPSDNMVDKVKKGRHRLTPYKEYPKGEEHGNSKLTRVDVEQIHLMSFAGASSRQISSMFPVAASTIRQILRGERWTDVYSSMVPQGSEGMI